MELNAIEVASVELALSDASDSQVRELNDLQLALIGGGSGDTIAY